MKPWLPSPIAFLRRALPVAFAIALGVSTGLSAIAADKQTLEKPKTVKTQALSKPVYETLNAAQADFDAKNYAGALAKLDALKEKFDKLNDYERGTLYSFYAAVHYAQEKPAATMEDYKKVLQQKDLPELLRNNTLYSIAQLSFVMGHYDNAIKAIKKWQALTGDIKPDSHLLIAQAQFQLKDYAASEAEIITALKLSKAAQIPLKESWLSLLRAVYFERKNYPRSTRVLEQLVINWPKASYWQQLAGLYGLTDRQADQLSVMRASYEAGLITSEAELLNLARLYLLNGAPYPASELLKKEMTRRHIAVNVSNLQLLAQALSGAKDNDGAVKVLTQLAKMSGESRYSVYLGQSYMNLGNWADAATAFRTALSGKDVQRAENIRMQLGMALYNAGKLDEAQGVFQSAVSAPETAQQATNWLKLISGDLQRRRSVGG